MKQSLKDLGFTENDAANGWSCSNKHLTSLEGCPDLVTWVDCSYNQITSLVGCPESVTWLWCGWNKLTSLKGCPNSVETLYCGGNQLTSLEGLPESVKELYCGFNPLNAIYVNKSLKDIHTINRFRKGMNIVNNIIWNHNANNIQRIWDDYWYKPNEQGESRVAKRQYTKYTNAYQVCHTRKKKLKTTAQ
uniref:Leucine rich repeat protein n=1 Tax=Marseillevirus LCMAC102 TaxID=2506603 RepID=A0A481YVV7_9VIRU|nr:MAG: hypothetical protein LCMAC102_04320 [Marseillevirus LCMAC102]